MARRELIFVVALLLIIGTGLYFSLQKRALEPVDREQFLRSVSAKCLNANEKEHNYVLAVKNNDISYCDKTHDEEACKAVISGELTLCENALSKNLCLAKSTKNSSYCNEGDAWCFALATGNAAYCTLMNTLLPMDKKLCSALAGLDLDFFAEEERKKECTEIGYFGLATATMDSSACAEISDEELRANCEENLNLFLKEFEAVS